LWWLAQRNDYRIEKKDWLIDPIDRIKLADATNLIVVPEAELAENINSYLQTLSAQPSSSATSYSLPLLTHRRRRDMADAARENTVINGDLVRVV
jgi:hypothetical protein